MHVVWKSGRQHAELYDLSGPPCSRPNSGVMTSIPELQ